MASMEKQQPNSDANQNFSARHTKNLLEKLPNKRLWKELKVNQYQSDVERHDGLRLWNQKEQIGTLSAIYRLCDLK